MQLDLGRASIGSRRMIHQNWCTQIFAASDKQIIAVFTSVHRMKCSKTIKKNNKLLFLRSIPQIIALHKETMAGCELTSCIYAYADETRKY